MVIGTSSYVRPLRGAMRPPEKPKRPRRYAVSPYLHSRFTDYHAHRIMGIPYKQTKPVPAVSPDNSLLAVSVSLVVFRSSIQSPLGVVVR